MAEGTHISQRDEGVIDLRRHEDPNVDVRPTATATRHSSADEVRFRARESGHERVRRLFKIRS
jgi:hypothetical protein